MVEVFDVQVPEVALFVTVTAAGLAFGEWDTPRVFVSASYATHVHGLTFRVF